MARGWGTRYDGLCDRRAIENRQYRRRAVAERGTHTMVAGMGGRVAVWGKRRDMVKFGLRVTTAV